MFVMDGKISSGGHHDSGDDYYKNYNTPSTIRVVVTFIAPTCSHKEPTLTL